MKWIVYLIILMTLLYIADSTGVINWFSEHQIRVLIEKKEGSTTVGGTRGHVLEEEHVLEVP